MLYLGYIYQRGIIPRKGKIMKKTIFAITIVLLCVFSLSAAKYDRADGFGIGLSAGYPVSGVAFKYGMGDFRVVGTFGYSFKDNVAVEAGVQYDLDSFNIDRFPFYLNFGITGAVNFGPIIDGFSINIPIGISYFLRDVPVELFFKFTPGIRIRSDFVGPDFGGALGALLYINR